MYKNKGMYLNKGNLNKNFKLYKNLDYVLIVSILTEYGCY